jgi:ABC-type multidrug transport system fused ATPase/permease subunit
MSDPPRLGSIFAYVRPHLLALLTSGLMTLGMGGTGLLLPLVVRALIADLSSHRTLTGVIVVMCLLVVAGAVLGAIGNYMQLRVAETIALTARKRLMDHLLRITVGALDRSEPGDLISRATADTVLLRDAAASCFVGFTVGGLTLVATLTIMAVIDPALLAVTAGTLGFAMVIPRRLLPRIGRATGQSQESVGTMGAALERMLGAFRTVKASGAESKERDHLHGAAVRIWYANLRAAKLESVTGSSAELAVQAAFVAVLATGGAQVASHGISVGTLVAFLLYVFYLLAPMQQLLDAVKKYQVAAAAVTRIHEAQLLPTEPVPAAQMFAVRDRTAEVTVADLGPASVEFEDVSFAYRSGLPKVHSGVSFAIPPGGTTALVGPSGAGKTTVFSLIERFYEPDSGKVLVDSRDVRDWQLQDLRATIGYVEQDAPVLSGTLRENLLFGTSSATSEELDGVLRTTRLSDLIKQLPDGLDTYVGHRGTRLSGGERQRVAIARALLRRPRLLLLDEATSQLDAINEAALRDTVADVARLITVLVVAHRLSTVTSANRIIVMDTGRVQAAGTHAELVAGSPLYAQLAATQLLTRETQR